MMKCPKDFNKIKNQQTLTESWFGKKRSRSDANIENDLDKDNLKKKFKSPKKVSPLENSTNSDVSSNVYSQNPETEYSSDENDVIQSSQYTRKSKLRNKISKSLGRKSGTPQSSPQKSSNSQLLKSPNKKLSLSDVSEVNSNVIKEEIVELLDDFKDLESIEMSHNLSDLLVDYRPSNTSDCISPASHLIKVEPDIDYEDSITMDDQLEDPLDIREEMQTEKHNKPTLITKKKKTIISKTIGRKKLKYILPTPKIHKNTKTSEDTPKKSKKMINKNTSSNESSPRKINESQNGLLPDKLLEKLKMFQVRLQHEVPPQHMIETSVARHLNPNEVKEFEKYGPLKRGHFSKEEDEVLKNNWESFCKVHNWDKTIVEPFLYMRYGGKYYIRAIAERRNLLRFLANGLPWRSLYSVHFRFRKLFDTSAKTGPYTPEEDRMILSYMSNGGDTKCAELAKLLDRKKASIWLRYKKLRENYDLPSSDSIKKKNKKKKTKQAKKFKSDISIRRNTTKIFTNIKWTSPLVKKFIDSIMKVTACDELMDLKDQDIGRGVWKRLETRMSIDRVVLQNFWYLQLHMQLFCPTPIYLNDIKVKLIECIYKEELNDSEEIDWQSISTHFKGVTPLFLSKLFEQLLKCAANGGEIENRSDALEYLHETYIPQLIEKSIDAILPKLFYHGGKIICIDKGSEKRISNKFTTDPFCDDDDDDHHT